MDDEDEEKLPITFRRSKKHLLVSEDEDERALRPNRTSQTLRSKPLITEPSTHARNARKRKGRVFQAFGASSDSRSDEDRYDDVVQQKTNKHFHPTKGNDDELESMQLGSSKRRRAKSSFSLKYNKKEKKETSSDCDSTDSDIQATVNDQYSNVARFNSRQKKSPKDIAENGKVKRIQCTNKTKPVLSNSSSEDKQNSTSCTAKKYSHMKMLLSSSDEDGPNSDVVSQSSTMKETLEDESVWRKKAQKKNIKAKLADSDVISRDGQIAGDNHMILREEEILHENDGKVKEVQGNNHLRTPINDKSCDNGKQTRSSTRLKMKQEMKGSMKLPTRRDILDKIPDVTPERDGEKRCKVEPRRLINNFFKEKSTYNCDRFNTYLSEDEEGEDDFIVYDSEYAERESAYSEDEKPTNTKSKKIRRKRKRKKFLSSCSSSDSSVNREVIPLKSRKISSFETDSSSEASNEELHVSLRNERKSSFILKSESEEDAKKDASCEGDHDIKLLPKRRNKEKEKTQRAASILRKKREIAQSNLPLDKRKTLEKEIDEEIMHEKNRKPGEESSTIDTDDEVLEYVNDVMRDSDKEFIVSSSDAEDKELELQAEEDFKLCLENLRKSGSNITAKTSLQQTGMPLHDAETEINEDQSRYRRVIMNYDSNDDFDDVVVENLFKLMHKTNCTSVMIRKLIQTDRNILESTDSYGRKPLHVASIVGNSQAVKALLDAGANANALDRKNMLSIAYAAYWKHSKVLRLLLSCTNLPMMHRLLHKHLKGMSLLHLIVLDSLSSQQRELESRQLDCLKTIQEFNPRMYSSLLSKTDKNQITPLLAAIREGNDKCVRKLLSESQSLSKFRTDIGGTVLHLAVEFSNACKGDDKSSCLRILLGHLKDLVDEPDRNGFTPLLYATETGNIDCMRTLLDHGATVAWQDNEGTSALHLAAAIGSTDCVKLLLGRGHPVDILDDCGWPPLLYANFQSCESCVVELMKVKPRQLFVLSSLFKNSNPKQQEKNLQVVRSTILSLANQDAYYQIFNDFIRQNPEILDEFNHGIFSRTWKAILDFENKRSWFRKRIWRLRNFTDYQQITVKRDSVLECAMEFFEGQAEIDLDILDVNFLDEPGVCTGPKREFLICLCNEAMLPEAKLFTKIDDQQFSPTPLSFFADIMQNGSGLRESTSQLENRPTEISKELLMAVKTELSYKLKAMQFLGRFVAACIVDSMYINLHLSKPFIKQILGQQLDHPDDLQSVDNGLYNGMVKWVLENSVNDMEMPFSITCMNPWLESRMEEVNLSKVESMLTDENKEEFTTSVSRFKLCDSIRSEVKAFKEGFYQEIRQDLVSIFTPDEFSLLMNGVQHIDVNDWKNNTQYKGWNFDDMEIVWFWRSVDALKQEEQALLLKFSTGSPCVPSGGFKELEGLGGRMLFTIGKGQENIDSIPTAATCFNMLMLSHYSSEKKLREQLLIAVRHGSEGFAFA